METSLHRQLKQLYAAGRIGVTGKHPQVPAELLPCPEAELRDFPVLQPAVGAPVEVTVDAYRIDAVVRGRLVEIQHGSLASIRRKVARLLEEHRVIVVKPIIVQKRLVKMTKKEGPIVEQRWSPKRGVITDLFNELVYFAKVFPHRRLTLDVPLVDVEEWRFPGHGRRRRWRRNDHQVADQHLLALRAIHRFHTASDLLKLVAGPLPAPFHTGDLATAMQVPRWIAQRAAYCLRHAGAIEEQARRKAGWMYQVVAGQRRAA